MLCCYQVLKNDPAMLFGLEPAMKNRTVLPGVVLLLLFSLFGCARTWQSARIEDYKPASGVANTAVCRECHPGQFDAWKLNRHGNESNMARIPVRELRECEACHEGTLAHVADPASKVPPRIGTLSKSEQNMVCGKCHYSQAIFGGKAINPHDRHALFMNVGLEGRKQQLSCMDCHSGHQGKSSMLVRSSVHICFKCHTSAIVTMGIFQPFNYLTFGKACQACHAVHGGSSGAQWTRMGVGFCVICHFVGVSVAG